MLAFFCILIFKISNIQESQLSCIFPLMIVSLYSKGLALKLNRKFMQQKNVEYPIHFIALYAVSTINLIKNIPCMSLILLYFW